MAIPGLVLYAIDRMLAFGLRSCARWRRTRTTGFKGLGGPVGSVEWWRTALVASLAALLIAAPAAACRCVPQSLEHYFGAAEVVFLGRVTSTRSVELGAPYVEAAFTFVEEPYKGRPEKAAAFVTPASSATCGVPVTTGRIYLVFASRLHGDAPALSFDTCNGTRLFDAASGEAPVGFVDTPVDKVLLRLEGLRVGAAVQDPQANPHGPRLPKPGDGGAEMIGLVELPSILNLDEPGADSPPPRRPTQPLVVYAHPEEQATVLARIGFPRDVVTREYDYERKAAVVRARQPGWYRIALAGERDGWLRERDAGPFRPVAELLVNRLNYLTEHWDGWVWPEPGAGHAVKSELKQAAGRQEYPANVLATQDLAGTLWLQVEILSGSRCEGDTPQVRASGWIPAYSPDGRLTAWFYSRGC